MSETSQHEVLFIASRRDATFLEACRRANTKCVHLENAPQAMTAIQATHRFDGVVFDPALEGTSHLVAWLRGRPDTAALPLIALADHPGEGPFVHGYVMGADDVVVRDDVGALTRRLAALGGATVDDRGQWRGLAIVAHPDEDRRRLLGRVLRRSGFELAFAATTEELSELLAADLAFVVVARELLAEDEGAHLAKLRASNAELPVVLLRAPAPTDLSGESRGRTGVLSEEAPIDDLAFLVNELSSDQPTELRTSPRLLYGTLCAFRRSGDLVPHFGLTYNVSRGGLFVRTLDPPAAGAVIRLELRPPINDEIMHLSGTVAWARSRSMSGGPSGFGVAVSAESSPPADLARYRLAYHRLREGERPYHVPALMRPDSYGVGDHHKGRILVADDDAHVRRVFVRILTKAGFEVVEAVDGQDAVLRFTNNRFDAVLTDLEMPRLSGLQLLRAIRERDDVVPVVIATGAPTLESAVEAVQRGAFRYLTKPVQPEEVVETLTRAVQIRRIEALKREALAFRDEQRRGPSRDEEHAVFNAALDKVHMHYQPIVRLAERSIFGFEALVRSNEPKLPHPGALFAAAERLDGLEKLSRAIRARTPGPFANRADRLLLNVHPMDLLDAELFESNTLLGRMASQVTLEITERASLDTIPDAKRRIASLRELGYSIAVDDIGAGYAGLSSFAQLEPEVAKIDMSLIRDIHRHPTKQRLVRSFCELCDDLGIELVVEGVETADERETLVELGAQLFQGYLFARPGPAFPEPAYD